MSGLITRHLCCLILIPVYALLTGCGQQVVLHSPEAYPQRLSEWHMVWRDGNSLAIHRDALVYDLNTALFSDYALKLRTLYLPEGQDATWNDSESFDFPVGTIVTKTFFYAVANEGSPGAPAGHTSSVLTRHTSWDGTATKVNFADFHVMETRILVRQTGGWDALPYIWNGNDAFLAITGKVIPANLDGETFAYLVPSRNECSACHVSNHTAKHVMPIGLKARHLNRTAPSGGQNQLVAMHDQGQLNGMPEIGNVARNAASNDLKATLDERARSYLDINCGHCHNAHGAADTSGLLLDRSIVDFRQLGQCKPTIAAGHGSGGRTFGIVPGNPDDSILLWRMQTTDPGARMPELGRSLVHDQGVELIRKWIADQSGTCS